MQLICVVYVRDPIIGANDSRTNASARGPMGDKFAAGNYGKSRLRAYVRLHFDFTFGFCNVLRREQRFCVCVCCAECGAWRFVASVVVVVVGWFGADWW